MQEFHSSPHRDSSSIRSSLSLKRGNLYNYGNAYGIANSNATLTSVFLKPELGNSDHIIFNNPSALKLNQKISKLKISKYTLKRGFNMAPEVHQIVRPSTQSSQMQQQVQLQAPAPIYHRAYNELDLSQSDSCYSHNNSIIDCSRNSNGNKQKNDSQDPMVNSKARPRTAVFQSHRVLRPDQYLKHLQQRDMARDQSAGHFSASNSSAYGCFQQFDSATKQPKQRNTQFFTSLGGKKKSCQAPRSKRKNINESKVKNIFNQVLQINKLTIQPIFNNIIITGPDGHSPVYTKPETKNACLGPDEQQQRSVEIQQPKNEDKPTENDPNQDTLKLKSRCLKHCMSRRAPPQNIINRINDLNSSSQNMRSPRSPRFEFSRESSSENLFYQSARFSNKKGGTIQCQSSNISASNISTGNNKGLEDPTILPRGGEQWNDQIIIGGEQEIGGSPGGNYSFKAIPKNAKVLKMKQVLIKNMDLEGI